MTAGLALSENSFEFQLELHSKDVKKMFYAWTMSARESITNAFENL